MCIINVNKTDNEIGEHTCFVETRTEDPGNLFDEGIRGQKGIILFSCNICSDYPSMDVNIIISSQTIIHMRLMYKCPI